MKNLMNYLTMIFMVVALGFIASCGTDDDDPVIAVIEGVNVGDGFYIAPAGVDALAGGILKTSTVDGPSFGALERSGFMQGYMYLVAGSYNMVEIATKQIVNTYGGSLEAITTVNNAECETSGYSLVKVAKDGAAFSVAADGLYVVAYDTQTGELAFDQIETAGIIGGATPEGWGADTKMTGTVSATEGSWKVEGVTLDKNQMKIRFNCRWAIDRRLDSTVDFANDNGYSFFTNFGNTLENLLPGNEGPNMEIPERGIYTVALTWDPASGFAASLTKTGEAEALPEYPAELFMIGDGIGGWDWAANGIQMNPVHSNAHLFWRIVWMEASAGIKFAPQKDWIGDFGQDDSAPVNGVYKKGGSNVPTPATAGYYMVVVNLDAGAETIEVNEPLVYGIGNTFGGWDAATEAYKFSVDNVGGLITSSAFVADDNLRIHTTASTFTPVGTGPAIEWWQAEFVVIGGNIEYRGTGGDQAAVPVTTGQTVSLNFKDGTGTIQ
jgi:hypothetical protein